MDGSKATCVIGLIHDHLEIPEIQKGILDIKGVFEVDFNYFTHKLTIVYDGSENTLIQIHGRLTGVTRVPR